MDMGRTTAWSWFGLVLAIEAGVGTVGCYETVEAPFVEPPECRDSDGDGWGQGAACTGQDCDDTDATVWDDCGADCAADPLGPGCACNSAVQPEVCYGGPAGTQAVGHCVSGLRICRDGAWTGCEGQVLPGEEECDYEDDDCDGVADDGVLSACGDCNAECLADCAGVGCDGVFSPGGGAEVAGDGSVTVGEGADLQPHQIWLVNSQGGTAVRVDTQTISVLGTYRTGPGQGDDLPQAVAMDGDGNAFVVNSRQGQAATTLTKILGGGCPDSDGSGVVDSSRDDEALDWGEDECVAWNVAVEECDDGWGCGYGWSLTLTESGRAAWVALYQGSRVVEVDTDAGALTGREASVPSPTGLVADADGTVWVTGSNSLRRFSIDDPEDVESFSLGDQSWATNVDVGDNGLVYLASPLGHYDPARDDDDSTGWFSYDVAVDMDGFVWGSDGQSLRRYESDLAEHESFSASGNQFQLAADRDGHIWGTDSWGSGVAVVEAATGDEVADEIDGCGDGCLSGAYLEGDPSGLRFRRAFGGGFEDATATHVFESDCGPDLEAWESIAWETSGGAVEISARSAYERRDLAAVPWTVLGSSPPEAGAVESPAVGPGPFLEVRAVLRERGARVVRITAEWSCFQGLPR
jgi:hypothetical protein